MIIIDKLKNLFKSKEDALTTCDTKECTVAVVKSFMETVKEEELELYIEGSKNYYLGEIKREVFKKIESLNDEKKLKKNEVYTEIETKQLLNDLQGLLMYDPTYIDGKDILKLCQRYSVSVKISMSA